MSHVADDARPLDPHDDAVSFRGDLSGTTSVRPFGDCLGPGASMPTCGVLAPLELESVSNSHTALAQRLRRPWLPPSLSGAYPGPPDRRRLVAVRPAPANAVRAESANRGILSPSVVGSLPTTPTTSTYCCCSRVPGRGERFGADGCVDRLSLDASLTRGKVPPEVAQRAPHGVFLDGVGTASGHWTRSISVSRPSKRRRRTRSRN